VLVTFDMAHCLKEHPSGKVFGVFDAASAVVDIVVDLVYVAPVQFTKCSRIGLGGINQGDLFFVLTQWNNL